jgi:hypothetical protein
MADITPTDIVKCITHNVANTTPLDEKLTTFHTIKWLNLTKLDEPFVNNHWICPLKAFKAFTTIMKTLLLPDVPYSFKEAMSSLATPYCYYYYLIKFNVHIQPLGYDRHRLYRRAPWGRVSFSSNQI